MTDTFTSPDIAEEVHEIVLEMLEGIAETSGGAVVDGGSTCAHQGVLVSTIGIVGGGDAEVVLRCRASTGCSLTRALLGFEESDVTDADICEAVSELSNILAGSLKTLIDEETALDIPKVQILQDADVQPLESPVLVEHDFGAFEVQITD